MLFRRFLTLLIAGVGVVMLGGCAWNPVGVSDAKPEGEVVSAPKSLTPAEQVLASMADLPSNEVLSLPSGLSATASPPYFAASGRQCRQVRLRGGEAGAGESRLACSANGATWTWYPSVQP